MIKYYIFLIPIFSFFTLQAQDSIFRLQAINYAKKAEIFHKKGDNDKHKLYNDSLLIISQKHKLDDLELLAIMNQGIYYKNTNQLKKALDTYLKVLDKCEVVPNSEKNKIMTLVNMGNIYNRIEDSDKAIAIFKEALPLINKYPNNGYIKSATYSGLGKANAISGNLDTALKYQYKLKALGDSLQNTYLKITAITDISELLNKKKEYTNGLKIAKEALQLNGTYKDSVFQKDLILLNIGIAYNGLKKLDTAKVFFNKAKTVAIAKKNTKIEMFAEKHLAGIYEKLKDFEASQISQKRYITLNLQYLEDQKETIVLDLKNEAQQTIKTTKAKNKKHTYILTSGFILLIVVLGGFLFIYIRKKQLAVNNNKQLQEDFNRIQSQYSSLNKNLQQLSKEKIDQDKNSKKYKNSSLNKKDRERYMNHILEYMEQEKPYLDFDLTQTGLAEKLDINTHHLSEVLTLSFQQNFYNFINLYRIDNAQKLLKNKAFKHYKIEAIAYDSGFKSKASFNRVFKNLTQKTPSQFRKQYLE